MSILKSLEVKGRISQPKTLMEQNEYWGTVEKGESIRISAEAEGRVLINGGDVLEYTPCVGLNVYKLTVEGLEGEFLVNIICREPEGEAFSQTLRPRLHFSPELFSLNDPNGLVYDEVTDQYHLFFQCDYPGPGYRVQGDTKAWGHAVSKDLISWKELPVALPADENGVIWSGSAVIDRGNTSGLFDDTVPPQSRIVLLYTYYGGKNGLGQASIGLAYSKDHGQTFINYGPIIRNENNIYSAGFRDPSVVWFEHPELDGGRWLLVACGDKALMLQSRDLISWEYASELKDKEGNCMVTECPNLFKFEKDGEETWVMMAAGAWYVFGDITVENGAPCFRANTDLIYPCSGVKELWGPGTSPLFPENYASQTFYNASEGRRIQMSWIRDFWYDPVNKPWWSFLSLPVELRLEEGRNRLGIGYYPIKEWSSRLTKRVACFNGELKLQEVNNELKGLGELLYIRARLKGEGSFGFSLHGGGALVYYDARRKAMVTDKSGSEGDYSAFKYDDPVFKDGEYADMVVIVDRHAVEAYVNGTYQGGMVYGGEGTEFIADCAVEGTVEIFELEAIERNRLEGFY
ncbi:MAG: glycoside hydrolase family 32 protein [Clostridia bacterium]|nr:glycoside hydrolase family 32 protein [Clostridia bacterium]